MPRIYLDNAATSFPKPEPVYDAIDRYNRRLGATAGRGAYASGIAAADVVHQCRLNLARLFHAESPNCFAFTYNGTDALNMALHGVLKPGDHVVTTVVEHNSILRPLRTLADRGVTVSFVDCDDTGCVPVAAVADALRSTTKLVVVTHASNVTGTIQPIADIAAAAKSAGAFLLVDAAQTAGHVPINLSDLPVDLLATSGHKGLLGPLGTGVLYVRPGMEEHLDSLRQGGTGTSSENDRHPTAMPDRLEAGNLNVGGIAGLRAATQWILEQGIDAIRQHETQLTGRLLDALGDLSGVHTVGPARSDRRSGIVSLAVDGWTPHDLAAVLDSEFGIEVRAGLHCAPLMHRRLAPTGEGFLRISVGAMTTPGNVEDTIVALKTLCES